MTNVSVGDRVMVYPGVKCNSCRYCLTGRDNLCPNKPGFGSGWDGGLAEYALVPEQSIIPVPDNVSLIDAASMPIIFMTVWHMLVTRARVQPGDTVLVNAAGSGVGIAGIQIAKLFHARVIASAGSDPKLEKARKPRGRRRYQLLHLLHQGRGKAPDRRLRRRHRRRQSLRQPGRGEHRGLSRRRPVR